MTTHTQPAPTPTEFRILLALLDGELHGYGIMLSVEALSEGAIRLGAGTLYGAIRRLGERGLIKESGARPDPELDDERRRYYRLTEAGRSLVESHARQLDRLVRFARRRLATS